MFKYLFSDRLFICALVFFVLTVGSSLLYSWQVRHTGKADLERTQQALRSLEDNILKQTPPVAKPPPPVEIGQSGAWNVDVSPSHAETETDRPATPPVPLEMVATGSESHQSTRQAEDTADFEAQLESMLVDEMQHFMHTMRDKYPILSMSQLELSMLTQTPEGKKEFWSQALKFSEESLDYIVEKFSLLPPERLEEAFTYAERMAMEHGQQIPAQFLQQGFERVRQRLNMSR